MYSLYQLTLCAFSIKKEDVISTLQSMNLINYYKERIDIVFVVNYLVTIVASGLHGLLKKFLSLVIGCVLHTAWSLII